MGFALGGFRHNVFGEAFHRSEAGVDRVAPEIEDQFLDPDLGEGGDIVQRRVGPAGEQTARLAVRNLAAIIERGFIGDGQSVEIPTFRFR